MEERSGANGYDERAMKLSRRTAWELETNAFATQLQAARSEGRSLVDLTVSNPTDCGFCYDEARLLAPLAAAEGLHYEPDSLGMTRAREAVRRYYADAGADVQADRICLTTSTSEAYSYLFRLLCDPGDELLAASPSYPLFDYIARLDGVRLVEYPLLYDDGWLMDLHALAEAITERTRAVLVVHPNNPTGHFCSAAERVALRELCQKRDLALIVDEVFLDYALPGERAFSFAGDSDGPLTFVLSGVSKVCGLPQMKCSWMAAGGSRDVASAAMERLAIVADTFLSMNAPVQHALPVWLHERHGFQRQVKARMAENLDLLDDGLKGTDCDRLAVSGGWTAVLRVPRFLDGHSFYEAAMRAGVIVQPGEFYGLGPGRCVVSLLTPVALMRKGVERLRTLWV